jgi:glycosyltransferase involved in cell wall biosynthesis
MPHTETLPATAEVPSGGRTALASVADEAARVSVIIPTLDEVKRIGSLLETFTPALRQRFELEVVVSDGGSTDGTLDIARRLADRVVVHPGPEPQNIAAGRNAGAAAARGNTLLFFNADVRFPEDPEGFLADLIAAAEHGAATCRVGVHPDEATFADRLVLGTCNVLFFGLNLVGGGMGRGECHAVRRDVFAAVGGYNEAYAAGEDFDLYHRIAQRARERGEGRIRFLWRWTLFEDPRRYRKVGYARTMWDWFRNSFCVAFLGRSYSDSWEPVR